MKGRIAEPFFGTPGSALVPAPMQALGTSGLHQGSQGSWSYRRKLWSFRGEEKNWAVVVVASAEGVGRFNEGNAPHRDRASPMAVLVNVAILWVLPWVQRWRGGL